MNARKIAALFDPKKRIQELQEMLKRNKDPVLCEHIRCRISEIQQNLGISNN